jgi:hypothetical protein
MAEFRRHLRGLTIYIREETNEKVFEIPTVLKDVL